MIFELNLTTTMKKKFSIKSIAEKLFYGKPYILATEEEIKVINEALSKMNGEKLMIKNEYRQRRNN